MSVYTLKILIEVGLPPAGLIKTGRRSRAREREEMKHLSTTNHQLKDKIYLLEKTWPNRRYQKLFRLIQMTVRRSWLIRAEL